MGPHRGVAVALLRADEHRRELAAARVEREALPVPPEVRDTDPQRAPRGQQGGDS